MEDKELNSFVGPKRLDPYRDDATTYKVNPYKLRSIREKVDFGKLDWKKQDKRQGKSNSNKSLLNINPGKEITHSALAFEPICLGGLNAERLATYSGETLQPKVR